MRTALRAEGFQTTSSMTGLFLLLFLTSGSSFVEASWLYLGLVSSLGASVHRDTCGLVPGLVYEQVELCRNSPDTITCVGEGVRRGIYECQSQFKFERWNCTTTPNQSVFGPVLNNGTKESAFIRAVTSAGVAHAVTQSCSAGNLTDCSCDMAKQGLTHTDGWKWGGCSDNVEYGIWFSRTFVDAPDSVRISQAEKQGDIHSLVNLHNNEAGRQTVKDEMKLKCRCHGVSGSCAVKSCWQKMPSFREVGAALKKHYEGSVEVAPRSTRKLRRREKVLRKVTIKDDELVYLEPSPNYCQPDPDTGVLGTTGRECKLGSRGPDSCDTLCCGRGYNTFVERHTERCFCKFIWCCYVKCKLCETVTDRHICK